MTQDFTCSRSSPEDVCVLLVEDDDIMRLSLEDRLELEGICVRTAPSLAEARLALAHMAVDMVITDVRLPDGSGRTVFEEARRQLPGVPVVLMTAYGAVSEAVELVKAGAMDYLTKPFRLEEFIGLVRRTLEQARVARLTTAFDGSTLQAGGVVLGRSPAMRRIERLVARIAPMESSVLITGESGVGKEVVAALIHHNSHRAAKPFIRINCAAIPHGLVESELFGHEKGAFTGAEKRRIGRFEQAQGGTLFLDEIAEVPPDVQVKLLRVLQERVIERVGGNETIPLDVRILAATQVDLQKAMEDGRFRSDLYWRLNVIHIALPPLRERGEDIPWLAQRLASAQATAMGKPLDGLTAEAEALLKTMPFPGNVRELKNLMERAVAFCDGRVLGGRDLFPLDFLEEGAEDLPLTLGPAQSLRETVEEAEQAAIRRVLDQHDWIITKAAEVLGISRKNLWEKMRRYGITR